MKKRVPFEAIVPQGHRFGTLFSLSVIQVCSILQELTILWCFCPSYKPYNHTSFDEALTLILYFSYGNLCKYFTEHYNAVSTIHSRLELMIQIADALAYLHGKLNTVHRDIKPTNILVADGDETNAEQVIVKISDFGAAKTFDPNDETSGMTTQIGTLAFKAPEVWDKQADGKIKKYHRSVDIFSEGLTFLAILQARCPKSSREYMY